MGKQKRYKQSDINPTGGNTGDVIKTTETNTQLKYQTFLVLVRKKQRLQT